jgi:hypothetical protein
MASPETVFHIRPQLPIAHLPFLRNPRLAYTTNSPAWTPGTGIGNGSERYNSLYEHEFARLHKLFNTVTSKEHTAILYNSELRLRAEERFDFLWDKIPFSVTLHNVRYREDGEIASHWQFHNLEKRREEIRKEAEKRGEGEGRDAEFYEEEIVREMRKEENKEQNMYLQVNVASLLVDLYNDEYYNAVNEGKPLQITAQKDIEGKGRVNVLEVRIVGRLRTFLGGYRGERIRKTRAKVHAERKWISEKAKQNGMFKKLDSDMKLIWNWDLRKDQQLQRKTFLKDLAKECEDCWWYRESNKRGAVMKVLRAERMNKGQSGLMGEERLKERAMRRFERIHRERKEEEKMKKRKEEKRRRREEMMKKAKEEEEIVDDQGQRGVMRGEVFWPLGANACAYPLPRP